MRNLQQYPITPDEVVKALDWAIHMCNEEAVGDITPLALSEAKGIITTVIALDRVLAVAGEVEE